MMLTGQKAKGGKINWSNIKPNKYLSEEFIQREIEREKNLVRYYFKINPDVSKSALKKTTESPYYKKFRNNIRDRVLFHGGSETINTIRDNNAVWFYLDDFDYAKDWGDEQVFKVKMKDIEDMVVIPDLNDVSAFNPHIKEKFGLKGNFYDVREILVHPKADEILAEWMEWSSKNDTTGDIGYNLYENGNVTRGAAVTVLGVIPKNKIQRITEEEWRSRVKAKGGNINWFKSKEGKGDSAITKRNKPNVNALEKYGAGEISYDDYLKISQKETPIKEIDVFYEPATYDEIYNALEKQNQKISTKQGKVPKQDVIDAPIEKGQAIGVRLDIPSYVRYNTWVVSIHDGHKQSGKPISYQAVVRIKDVTFGTIPSFAFLIAIGDVPKNTIGRMYGYYDPIEGKTPKERSGNTKKLINEIKDDKSWAQVGMNPFRHSYFYLRKNGMPVVSADEVVQIGGLVYAKNAKTVKPDDDEFKIDNSRVKEKYPGITHFNKGGENDITDLAYTVAWDCHIGGNRPNIDVVKKDIKKLMIEENIGMHYLLTNCYDYFEKGGLI
tara:strand:- start:544 stop:2199 length:1656 start_codon:yes stop_codon:yes gene_type:complete